MTLKPVSNPVVLVLEQKSVDVKANNIINLKYSTIFEYNYTN